MSIIICYDNIWVWLLASSRINDCSTNSLACSSSPVSVSESSDSDQLNLVTDPVQPAHHCYQSASLIDRLRALQNQLRCQLSTFC